jgi:phosphoribosylanthranilate isomerase
MKSALVKVKICGIKDAENLRAALDAGADYIGFIFAPSSCRFISPAVAAHLTAQFSSIIRPAGRKLVAVLVDPSDQELADVLTVFAPDILQLHGQETPERIREIGDMYDLTIMKAISVTSAEDVDNAKNFIGYADMLLFDAQSGGMGKTFDWNLLRHFRVNIPWFLSGGLNAANIQEAIRITRASQVDVSSGVESSRGHKDPQLIRDFISTAKTPFDRI